MKSKRERSFAILLIFLFSVMLLHPLSIKVKAESSNNNVPQYKDVINETIGFFEQYKNKTIIKNTVFTDNNIKYSVYENGEKHVITDDFDKIRWMRFMGIYNDSAYSICYTLPGKPIYRADLNTYKFELVKNTPAYPKGQFYYDNYSVDNNGAFWFSGTDSDNSIIVVQDGVPKYIKYIVYSDNGFSFETSILYQPLDNRNFGKPTVGYDGNVWFYKSFNNGADNKVYMVTADKQLHQFDVISGDIIKSLNIGANGNVYMSVTTNAGMDVIKQYRYNNDKLEFVKQYNEQGRLAIDGKGNPWFDLDGGIYKLEGDNFVRKYTVGSGMSGLKVYDDNHMAVGGLGGVGLTIISIADNNPSTPTIAPEKFTTIIDNDTKSAVLTLDSSQVAKNGVNEIIPTLSADVHAVEAKIDAATINGGTGSLKLNANNITMELPFSTVDYDGTAPGSYISVKQNITTNDPTLSSIKDIGKVFDFNLATYNQDGTKIKDIHNFKSGKAKITVKLTSEEIKNLDSTKLGAYYYNEDTKIWELLGGIFDKNAMTFTFETPHFSKYTIAQINGTLPQTGAFLSSNDLIKIALVIMALGVILYVRKPKRK
jgi:hypothetical protein